MPIISRTNQYRGVNAHLHSQMQREFGGWDEFHHAHITHIAEGLNEKLPRIYRVRVETSLQIRDSNMGLSNRRPDIYILKQKSGKSGNGGLLAVPASAGAAAVASAVAPVQETLDIAEEERLTAIGIYRTEESQLPERKPITWLELLSPYNKPPGKGYSLYRVKRNDILRHRVVLIEIDYLHEKGSPVMTILASYPDKAEGARPYAITVSDPRPDLQTGQARAFAFGVDEPIPAITIPLAGDDKITFDFNEVYQRTFSSLASFYEEVDYEQLPEKPETYMKADWERIQKRQAVVLKAIQEERDLSDAPFPVDDSA